ncbi:hypothetical protein DDT56_07510 [Brenneria corticis]|uniref:Uncharacterized protein n=1 Tax=Brenneria corticis TaxID=2173106 RepID=A0A2U1U6R6_9GAMM|nr:hypothetical protein DDT56_07510 [Brenneria sp. CFCC 11842]
MEQDVLFTTKSWVPVFVYYAISTGIFALLYYIKTIIDKKGIRPLFIFFRLFVPVITAIQFCIFFHGTSFVKDILRIDFNVDLYDSVIWGALFFSIINILAMPRNNYIKWV